MGLNQPWWKCGKRLRGALLCISLTVASAPGPLCLLTHRDRPGITADSVVYIGVAREMRSHGAYSVPFGDERPRALTHFPPLYPALLAALGPDGGGRWVNIALLGITSVLVGLAVARSVGRVQGILAASLISSGPAMISVHAMMWSEPLFLLLIAGGVLALSDARVGFSMRGVGIAAACFGLAALTRYAALPFVIAAGGWGMTRWPRRLTLLFVILSAGPSGLWFLRNIVTVGESTNRHFAFHPVEIWKIITGLQQFEQMFGPELDRAACAVLAAGVAGVTTLLLVKARTQDPRVVLTLLLAVAYVVFLVASMTFFDHAIPLDFRTQSPLYVLLILAAAFALRRSRVFVLAGISLLGANVLRSGAAATRPQPPDFLAKREILTEIRELPNGTPIYSNAPDLIYLQLGKPAVWLPTNSLLSHPFDPQCVGAAAVVVIIPDVRATPVTAEELIGAGFAASRITNDGVIWKRAAPDGGRSD